MSEEYDIDSEMSCPVCGHSPLHYRTCSNWCDDGYFDESDDDPINFMPGESQRICSECRGTGTEWWCPKCGENLSGILSFANTDDPDEDGRIWP
jgi:DnaJ-class molecular chaperone